MAKAKEVKKVPFKYSDTMNPELKEKQYFVQGKRYRVRPEKTVEVPKIIADIEEETRKLQNDVCKSDDKFVVFE